ncbi:amidohydrolase [Saliphagus sp. LR7]|uniref:amidohydrolase n=1 Tax=Saliphagus sp. LR7 TaxID=2282654 RepID=UPI000DF7D948|nr:amidohydrolase [Saliphagus sp. LR7]
MNKSWLFDQVEQDRERLLDLALQIWETPELGLHEHESSQILIEALREEGFDVRTGVSDMPTAFVASYGEGSPKIGILGEYDALPELSQKVTTEREPVEEGKPGHGCGHNLFGVGSLGGAVAVKRAIERDELEGTIAYYGCPAEENADGKTFMARDGVFDDLEAALAWHPASISKPDWRPTLAMDSVKFTFEGISAHAAGAPESGRSALDAVQLMNTGVENMREHVSNEARIHYAITEGGTAPNVVPAEATVWYYVRAPTRDEVDRISSWVTDVAEGAAKMTQTTVDRNLMTGISEYLPNETVTEVIWENMQAVGPIEYTDEDRAFAAELQETVPAKTIESQVEDAPEEIRAEVRERALCSEPVKADSGAGELHYGSTDVADVSWNTATGQFRAAALPIGVSGHSWQAVSMYGGPGRKSVNFVAKVLAGSAYDLMTDSTTIDEAWEEFERETDGQPYDSPLPKDATPPFDLTE